MTREDAIRALSRKILRECTGKHPDVVGASLATAMGRLLVDCSGTDEACALRGVDAILGDVRQFVKLSYSHKGTAQ